jgi:hypothetical protein
MASADDMRKKYFTEDGEKALFNRLKTLIDLYEKGITYPFAERMLGFVPISIGSVNAHESMINELRQILGLSHVIVTEKDEHGRSQTKEIK